MPKLGHHVIVARIPLAANDLQPTRAALVAHRLDLVAPFEPPDEVTWRWELGLTVGPSEKWRVFKKLFTVPRLGLSYRGGSGTSGIRFVIRSRY